MTVMNMFGTVVLVGCWNVFQFKVTHCSKTYLLIFDPNRLARQNVMLGGFALACKLNNIDNGVLS